VRTGPEGLSGGNWMVPASRGAPWVPLVAGRLRRAPSSLTNFCPLPGVLKPGTQWLRPWFQAQR